MRLEKSIPALNGVRAIAATLVVFEHYSSDVKMFKVEPYIFGQMGVMIFFVLSGFLMMHVTYQKQPNAVNIHNFFVDRLSRILPLFAFTLVLAFVYQQIFAVWLGFGSHQLAFNSFKDPTNVIYNLFFLKGSEIFWTIGVEVAFYVIFPILWFANSRKFGSFWLIAVAIIIVGIQIKTNFRYAEFPHFTRLNLVVHYFILGCLLHLAVQSIDLTRFSGNQYVRIFAFALVVVALLITVPGINRFLFGDYFGDWDYNNYWSRHWYILISLGIIFFVVIELTTLNTILNHPWLQYLGAISFSIYLMHRIVARTSINFGLTDQILSVQIAFFIVYVMPLTILISHFTYKFIERPSQSYLRKKFRQDR